MTSLTTSQMRDRSSGVPAIPGFHRITAIYQEREYSGYEVPESLKTVLTCPVASAKQKQGGIEPALLKLARMAVEEPGVVFGEEIRVHSGCVYCQKGKLKCPIRGCRSEWDKENGRLVLVGKNWQSVEKLGTDLSGHRWEDKDVEYSTLPGGKLPRGDRPSYRPRTPRLKGNSSVNEEAAEDHRPVIADDQSHDHTEMEDQAEVATIPGMDLERDTSASAAGSGGGVASTAAYNEIEQAESGVVSTIGSSGLGEEPTIGHDTEFDVMNFPFEDYMNDVEMAAVEDAGDEEMHDIRVHAVEDAGQDVYLQVPEPTEQPIGRAGRPRWVTIQDSEREALARGSCRGEQVKFETGHTLDVRTIRELQTLLDKVRPGLIVLPEPFLLHQHFRPIDLLLESIELELQKIDSKDLYPVDRQTRLYSLPSLNPSLNSLQRLLKAIEGALPGKMGVPILCQPNKVFWTISYLSYRLASVEGGDRLSLFREMMGDSNNQAQLLVGKQGWYERWMKVNYDAVW